MNDKSSVLAPASTSLLYALLATAQRYLAWLERELKAVGLSPTLYETLAQLDRADRPLSLRELAEGQRCAPSNITQKMDRLEREGLVRRVDAPVDRRVVLAEITPLGRKRTKAAAEIVSTLEAAFESDVPTRDRAHLSRILDALN